MCCDNVGINKNKVYIYILHIKLDNTVYSYTAGVNLMLICTEWSEMWSFIVNIAENSRYLK